MQSQNPLRSTHRSLLMSMSKCAIALLCCAFSIEPLFAQELDWRYYGQDLYNSRFQNIDQINPTNVSQLKPAWTFHTGVLGDPNMSMEMTPLVINGTMYVTTGDDDFFALNATTGVQNLALHAKRHGQAVHAPGLLQQRQPRRSVRQRVDLQCEARRAIGGPECEDRRGG